jgi:hypothetical protein
MCAASGGRIAAERDSLEGSTGAGAWDSFAAHGVSMRSSSMEAFVRTWLSELRIGLIAGLSAGAMIVAAPRVASLVRHDATASSVGSTSWTPPLVDPIAAAGAALARGDSTFLAVAIDDSLRFPGITAVVSDGAAHESVRLYSPASTGLTGARWAAFVPRVLPYAAAYNAVVQVARLRARARA